MKNIINIINIDLVSHNIYTKENNITLILNLMYFMIGKKTNIINNIIDLSQNEEIKMKNILNYMIENGIKVDDNIYKIKGYDYVRMNITNIKNLIDIMNPILCSIKYIKKDENKDYLYDNINNNEYWEYVKKYIKNKDNNIDEIKIENFIVIGYGKYSIYCKSLTCDKLDNIFLINKDILKNILFDEIYIIQKNDLLYSNNHLIKISSYSSSYEDLFNIDDNISYSFSSNNFNMENDFDRMTLLSPKSSFSSISTITL